MVDPGDQEVWQIQFDWLVRLRWWVSLVEIVAVAATDQLLTPGVPLLPIGALMGLGLASNLAAWSWRRRGRAVADRALLGLLLLDVLLLTGVLALSGGPFNPFSFLYLVHVSLGALLLGPRGTWSIAGLSILCSASLFLVLLDPDSGWLDDSNAHMRHMRLHLYGMWLATGLAALLIVAFMLRIRAALRARDAELYTARVRAAQAEKFASLATLAGGAAHELATPLSTIAVVATDLQEELAAAEPAVRDDLKLIRTEVERCRSILQALAAEAGQAGGEVPEPTTLAALLEHAVEPLQAHGTVLVQLPAGLAGQQLLAPRQALALAIRGLVKNALQASASGQPVRVEVQPEASGVRLEIVDDGMGMAPELVQRVGEPFFTTKEPGQGLGLGLYLARTIIERMGGTLTLASSPGCGTRARIVLPLAPGAAHG